MLKKRIIVNQFMRNMCCRLISRFVLSGGILLSRGHQVPKGVEPTVMIMMMIDDDDDVHDHDHNDLNDDNYDDVDDKGGDD